jgi:hypothetical protein
MAAHEHRKSLLVFDFLGALVCAFLVGVVQDFTSHSGDEISSLLFWRTVVLALECYAIVAVLILPWKTQFIPQIPNCFIVLVVGSIVYYFAIHAGDTLYVQKFRYIIWDFLGGMLLVTVFDCVLTVPLMAVVHFSASKLLRVIRVLRLGAT